MLVNNFLTFDVEEWYHANYNTITTTQYQDTKTNLDKNINQIIDLCDKYEVKSTCFVLGELAYKKPELIKKLSDNGHEIASHSNSHKLVYNMSENEFKKDLRISCDRIEQAIGKKVLGYRAPSWSVKEENLSWFYEALTEEGIKYSSSIYPSYTYLYGVPNFPTKPHFPIVNNQEVKVLEIPQSLIGFAGKKVGFAGGFYLRFFPKRFIKNAIKSKNKKNESVFIYLHPREMEPSLDSMNIKLKFPENLIHYYGLKGCAKKLEYLTKEFANSFIKMEDFYNSYHK